MGTDIHGIFQAKKNGKWVDIAHNYSENQHYLLFAWLGNVRNGFGVDGIPTHDQVTPISDNRGLPVDFELQGEDNDEHPTILNCLDEWNREWLTNHPEECQNGVTKWMGYHSHSWVTADEVLEAPLPDVMRTGVLTIEQYHKWEEGTQPEGEYYGDIWGKDIYICEIYPPDPSEPYTHVRVQWQEPSETNLDYFINEIKRLKDIHGEVRFVFGFDS